MVCPLRHFVFTYMKFFIVINWVRSWSQSRLTLGERQILIYGQIRDASLLTLHVFGLCKETKAPGVK